MGRAPIKEITEIQAETLAFIKRHIRGHGMTPTIPEIAEEFGIQVSTTFARLKGLEKKGYITRGRGPRSIRITSPKGTGRRRRGKMAVAADGTLSAPIVGEAAAGTPILAEENITGYVQVDALLARGRCYALKVRGDSMADAGIEDGDLVIVRQQQVAEKGDVIVALVNNEAATIKRLYIDDDRIELRPENDRHEPIPIGPDDDLKIIGKVLGVRPSKREEK